VPVSFPVLVQRAVGQLDAASLRLVGQQDLLRDLPSREAQQILERHVGDFLAQQSRLVGDVLAGDRLAVHGGGPRDAQRRFLGRVVLRLRSILRLRGILRLRRIVRARLGRCVLRSSGIQRLRRGQREGVRREERDRCGQHEAGARAGARVGAA
jgi:hypothetical protein